MNISPHGFVKGAFGYTTSSRCAFGYKSKFSTALSMFILQEMFLRCGCRRERPSIGPVLVFCSYTVANIMTSSHPKGLALEVSLPRRSRGFESGIDNPAEGESPAPGQRGLFAGQSASEKFHSPSLGAALRSARAKSGRRFAPYAHPELCPPPTPGSAAAQLMSEMELTDYIMFGGPVSSRTRTSSNSSTWSSTSSSVDSSGRRPRVPRHLRALAQAAEYSSSTSPSPKKKA